MYLTGILCGAVVPTTYLEISLSQGATNCIGYERRPVFCTEALLGIRCLLLVLGGLGGVSVVQTASQGRSSSVCLPARRFTTTVLCEDNPEELLKLADLNCPSLGVHVMLGGVACVSFRRTLNQITDLQPRWSR